MTGSGARLIKLRPLGFCILSGLKMNTKAANSSIAAMKISLKSMREFTYAPLGSISGLGLGRACFGFRFSRPFKNPPVAQSIDHQYAFVCIRFYGVSCAEEYPVAFIAVGSILLEYFQVFAAGLRFVVQPVKRRISIEKLTLLIFADTVIGHKSGS